MPKLKENPVEEKIYCWGCDEPISFETYDENNGYCQDCLDDINNGRTKLY